MNARYWQKGETLDYTATEEAVTNGQVVSLGGRIGVAGNDIAKGETGALHVTGVFIMEKATSVAVTMAPPSTLTKARRRSPRRPREIPPPATPPQMRGQVTPPCWSISEILTARRRRWPPCMTAWR